MIGRQPLPLFIMLCVLILLSDTLPWKKTMSVVQMSSLKAENWHFKLSKCLPLIKKKKYFRLMGEKSITLITHDFNCHLSFTWADWPQGTICQLFLWWVGSSKHDTLKLLPTISMSLSVLLSKFFESQTVVEVKLCNKRNCTS